MQESLCQNLKTTVSLVLTLKILALGEKNFKNVYFPQFQMCTLKGNKILFELIYNTINSLPKI